MENLFDRVDFEPGMYFLADVLSDWIENNKCGFANAKNENFSIKFVFLGTKSVSGDGGVKRELVGEKTGGLKKMRKLNVSMESLNLENVSEQTKIDQNESPDVKLEVENNAASGSRGCGRKRKESQMDISGGHSQSKNYKKK